ncbi:protein PLANT CADMIUM RESISTANCE 7-like [Telopea speciosissima]|uniref:protein PLANT CADMIUM RESISTANCE 7-like n=1 Tax=Telopea speciosissima TaxID=54955 RepID=UPI001CC343E2|nr:protein PLANT CADMIUM RESISTANCE 7-like [Telopea speciosissima]
MYQSNGEAQQKSAAQAAAPYPSATTNGGGQNPIFNGNINGSSTPTEPWSTGLFDCFQDPNNCLITCCCPCVSFGQIAEVVDRGQSSCAMAGITWYALAICHCACLYSCTFRTKLRALYSLQEDPCADCLVHWCCMGCALCQEFRELKIRGVDPSIGWQANVEKWNKSAATTPPTVKPGMTR